MSNDVLVIRPTERVGADYLAAILRSDFFIDYVMRGAKGVKMPRGEISMIREFPVPNPCPEEQQRIADCLSSLDDLIAAETQKLDTLKTHKKGLMQQLFPREGETVPRLRFPEFREAGEWKIKSLGTVCTVLQGYGFPETLQGRTEGQYPFCKVSDISRSVAENGGFLAKAANYVNANDLATLRAKLIPIGATVFAKIGEALRLNRRAFVQCECLIDNNAVGLKAVPGVANDYFIYLLSQLINLNDHCGGAVPSVNKSTLEAIEVVVPEVDEQEKIAASMSYHDELIRNQEKKLGILKIHKAGLMQQLFPVLNGEQA
ncbi:TPA: restriction endonuclease subunit S [Enterobacter roggenkampii]|nr:restriction endonuclease subunit S [Enterobacter roggenkampii]